MNVAYVFGAPHYEGAVLHKDAEGKVQISGGKEESASSLEPELPIDSLL